MAPLTLTVLGASGSYPGPGAAASGYLLQCGATNLWLDAGPGTLAELQRHVRIEDVTAVVITHEHVDHWSDLEHLAVACHYLLDRPPVPVFAETDLTASMRVGAAVAALQRHPIGPAAKVTIGSIALSFARTDHSVPTLAVRADAGERSLGYSADSGPGWGLAALGSGLDLALCEATHLADREGTLPHMSARQAGASARQAGVSRLLLTHLWPRVDPAAVLEEGRRAFGGPTELARPGQRYEV